MGKKLDLIGLKFGKLTVLKKSNKIINYKAYWDCMCNCGNYCTIDQYRLKSGLTVSCGCRAKEAREEYLKQFETINDIGHKYGLLTIIEDLGVKGGKGNRIRKVLAECECGTRKEFILSNLRRLHTRSCGCLPNKGNTQHGLYYHPLYTVWWGMHLRCYNENNQNYKDYGQRGVKICKEWKENFMQFYNWAIKNGWEIGLELDKDTKGSGLLYAPDMCVFITPKNNCRKRRSNIQYTYKGETKILIEWAELFKIPYKKLYSRVKISKWPIEKALTTP